MEYYYDGTISNYAARLLAEVGFKPEIEDNSPDEYPGTDVHCLDTYGHVFSYLHAIDLNVYIIKDKKSPMWHSMVCYKGESKESLYGTWKEVAEIGLKMAVDFIKADRK